MTARMYEIEIEGIGSVMVDEYLYQEYKDNGDKLPDEFTYTFSSLGGSWAVEPKITKEDVE